MSKSIKLGEKATMFFDPISGLKVIPGQVVTPTKNQLSSKKVTNALRYGHLEYTDEKPTGGKTSTKETAGKVLTLENLQESDIPTKNKTVTAEFIDEWFGEEPPFDELDVDSLKEKFTAPQLVDIAIDLVKGEFNPDDWDFDDEEEEEEE